MKTKMVCIRLSELDLEQFKKAYKVYQEYYNYQYSFSSFLLGLLEFETNEIIKNKIKGENNEIK